MKKLKVSAKLFVGFGIVLLFALVIGIVGFNGMTTIDRLSDEMYSEQFVPLEELSVVNVTLSRMRIYVREMVIASMNDDMAEVENSFGVIVDYMPVMEKHMDLFRAAMVDPEQVRIFDEARSLYENDLTQTVVALYDASQRQDFPAIHVLMDDCRRITALIEGKFDTNLQYMRDGATALNEEATRVSNTQFIAIIAVVVVALIISIILVIYISGLISKPLVDVNAFMKRAGVGDISLSAEENDKLESYIHDGDEIGQFMGGLGAFIDHMINVSNTLETIASGDLTTDIKMLSEKDTIGKSVNQMVDNFNSMFGEINSASSQVSMGSKQIASGAQTLAQGSTEQAASMQQLSASIAEIAEKTKSNTEMANRAAQLAGTIMSNAEKGSGQMSEMTTAVRDINQASQSISKVIKVIDDIAFQTNILALNAAVEAARAGQHGKGFAVVAEEVRSLAAKSADAAKDTGGLIADSMEKAELGARIAEETATSLNEIVSGIHESDRIVNEIAKASEEQSAGITQINTGIDQVAQVVQQNSATAEESSAASQEMSGQSDMLGNLIAQFKLKDGAAARQSLPPSGITAQRQPPAPQERPLENGSDGFGKY